MLKIKESLLFVLMLFSTGFILCMEDNDSNNKDNNSENNNNKKRKPEVAFGEGNNNSSNKKAKNRKPNIYRDLYDAIRYRDIKRIKEIIVNNKIDLNKEGWLKMTPLESLFNIRCKPSYNKSAIELDLEIAKFLIANGADVKIETSGGNALIKAIENRYYHIVDFLINNGSDVNSKISYKALQTDIFHDRTALISACLSEEKEIVKLLISKGADVNKTTEEGATPLMCACYLGNSEIFELLISQGADINKMTSNGYTALKLTLDSDIFCFCGVVCDKKKYKNKEVIAVLLKNTVNKWKEEIYKAIKNKDNINFKKYILKVGSICFKDQDGNNLLHIAAKLGNLEIFKFVFINNIKKYKINDKAYLLNKLNNINQSVLDLAFENNHYELLEFILSLVTKFGNNEKKLFELDFKECIEKLFLNVDCNSNQSFILKMSIASINDSKVKELFKKYFSDSFTDKNKTELLNRQILVAQSKIKELVSKIKQINLEYKLRYCFGSPMPLNYSGISDLYKELSRLYILYPQLNLNLKGNASGQLL